MQEFLWFMYGSVVGIAVLAWMIWPRRAGHTRSLPKSTIYEDFRAMPVAKAMSLLDLAWGLIANAGNGNWDTLSADWVQAAEKWRDEYHSILKVNKEAADADNRR